MSVRRVLCAAGASALTAIAAGAWAPAASAAIGDPVPPVPPKNYVNTTKCVSAANSGAKLKNGVSWAQTQLNYPDLWDLGMRGAQQTVAVIDTGVNQVSAFSGRVIPGGDYIVPKDRGINDCDGHGTIVASLIAADPDDATGFAGVAPDARVLAIRQSSSYFGVKNAKQGSGDNTAGTTTSLALAIRFAVDSGATVINISEASCQAASAPADPGRPDVVDAVQYAMDHDVVVVAAAGNVDQSTSCSTQNTPDADPVTLPVPADVPGVLAVGAVDESGAPASFSLNGKWVGVAAPGVDITATDPVFGTSGQINQLVSGNGTSPIQGTSFAAPYVAGLVALLRDRFPDLTAQQLITRIERTAQHPAAPGGRNDSVGYGMIDPQAALTATLPGETSSATPRSGPAALPAAVPHTDPDRQARKVALLGSLVLLVVIAAGAVAMTSRRSGRRAAVSARRALGR